MSQKIVFFGNVRKNHGPKKYPKKNTSKKKTGKLSTPATALGNVEKSSCRNVQPLKTLYPTSLRDSPSGTLDRLPSSSPLCQDSQDRTTHSAPCHTTSCFVPRARWRIFLVAQPAGWGGGVQAPRGPEVRGCHHTKFEA